MSTFKAGLLGVTAACCSAIAPAANVVARNGNVWPTRTIDVVICDLAGTDRFGTDVCRRQKPGAGRESETARLDPDRAALIRNTIARWNSEYGQNIRLREVRRPNAASTIVFRRSSRGSRCSTQGVGYEPGQRFKYISIGSNCSPRLAPDGTSTGIVAHEILHAIGLHHEQQRSDRGDMARVKRVGNKSHQWERTCDPSENRCRRGEAQARPVGTYDFDSIMHYSVSPKTVKLTPAGRERLSWQGLTKAQVGQREWLSKADERGIRQLYPSRKSIRPPKAA